MISTVPKLALAVSRNAVTGRITLKFATMQGRTYVVSYSDDLMASFQMLTSFRGDAIQHLASIEDPGPESRPQRFYRVTETP